jgi:hypothetical protein
MQKEACGIAGKSVFLTFTRRHSGAGIVAQLSVCLACMRPWIWEKKKRGIHSLLKYISYFSKYNPIYHRSHKHKERERQRGRDGDAEKGRWRDPERNL